jgi:DNA gyrase/topoisomerase IV subunit B
MFYYLRSSENKLPVTLGVRVGMLTLRGRRQKGVAKKKLKILGSSTIRRMSYIMQKNKYEDRENGEKERYKMFTITTDAYYGLKITED